MPTISLIDDHIKNSELLAVYKTFFPNLEYVQRLKVSDLEQVAVDGRVEWDKIAPHDFQRVAIEDIDPKVLSIGVLVYDSICFCIGNIGLALALKNSTKLASVAKSIYEALEKAAPEAIPKIVQIAREMGPGATKLAQAWKIVDIILTFKDAAQIDMVWNAVLGSLTWWLAALYGLQGLVTIFAMVTTGGASLVAQLLILLVGITFLAVDVAGVLKAFDETEKEAENLPPVTPGGMSYRTNVAIRTFNGNYLTFIENGGIGRGRLLPNYADIVHTDSQTVGAWETLTFIPGNMEQNTFFLKTASGNYLSAVNGGGMGGSSHNHGHRHKFPIHTDATSIGDWEKLVIFGPAKLDFPHDSIPPLVAIGTSGDYFLTVEGGGGRGSVDNASPIHSNSTKAGPWETFSLVRIIS